MVLAETVREIRIYRTDRLVIVVDAHDDNQD